MNALVVVTAIRLTVGHGSVVRRDGDDLVCLAGGVGDLRGVEHDRLVAEDDLDQWAVSWFADCARLRRGGGKAGRRGCEHVGGREVDRGGEVDAVAAADLRGGVLNGSGSRRMCKLWRVVNAQSLCRAE